MRAFHLTLAIGTIALLSVPLRGQPRPAARDTTAVRAIAPRVLPGTKDSVFATVQGNALNAANEPIPRAPVRLRDARFGRIAAEQRTDGSGLFTFHPVDPGTYVVELTTDRSVVLAASDIVTVGASETASTIVQLPARVLGSGAMSSGRTSLLALLSSATAAGVLATKSTVAVSEDRPQIP